MPKITILIGFLLVALGLFGYFGGESSSLTAMFPAFFGAGLCIFGFVSLRESWRMHGMHGALGISLLGFLGGAFRGIPQLIGYFSSDNDVNQRAMVFVLLMTLLCLVHVVLCVRSFIQARKNKGATSSDKG